MKAGKNLFLGSGSIIVLTTFFFLYYGCGNKNETLGAKSSTGNNNSSSETAAIGMDNCVQCHLQEPQDWLTSSHANLQAVDHTTLAPLDLGLNSDGFPYYGYFTDASCTRCHDPLNDGHHLVANVTGNVPRPVVGCESCHGGGAEHYGVGPIPYPSPTAQNCSPCHNSTFPDNHLLSHPTGRNIFKEYSASPHARSINAQTIASGSTVKAVCSRCHTDENFRTYAYAVPGTTGYAALSSYFSTVGDLPGASNIQCRTCHGAHTASKNQLEIINGATVAGETQSPQYNTCTDCHQLDNANGLVLAGATNGAFHDPSANPVNGNAGYLLLANHAGVPGDTRLNTGANKRALYFVNKTDKDSCDKCHDPHSADLTVNRQYAQSGHGDPLADPWTHYDWKNPSRGACQRCHTSTGFKNYANSLITNTVYDSTKNDFSYLAGNDAPNPEVDTNDQNETLYCWACHTDYKGGLRQPPAIIPGYKAMDGTTVNLPDARGSNVCLACHSGRDSGGSIAISTANFANTAFINSHYLAAGGILYQSAGYMYSGRDYSNGAFEHPQIGMSGSGTGTNGPCVGCHMHTNPQNHLLSPVTQNGDTITAITSTACATSHGSDMTVSRLNNEQAGLGAAMSALNDQLKLKGFCFKDSSPYFFTVASGCATKVSDWTNGVSANGKPNMGACFNYNLLEHEPGAFVHNPDYVKRLIYDSINWIDDYSLNGSVYGTLNALNATTYPYKAEAMSYLLVGNSNTLSDRP